MPVKRARWGRGRAVAGMLVGLMWMAGGAGAEPWHPRSDQEVVETLPLQTSARKEAARWRQALAASPRDASLAVAAARSYLELARSQGDARYAGLALGALAAWPPTQAAPADVSVMRASVAQYLHDFDGAAALLQGALSKSPKHAQAWLTLATVRRVQARLADSDAACQALQRLGHGLHGQACLAENQSLRGQHDSGRQVIRRLMGTPEVQGTPGQGHRQWLLTTWAELEERAGRDTVASELWRQAQALGPHPYVQVAHADHLLRLGAPQQALALLQEAPQSDAVLLRLVVAARQVKDPRGMVWAAELQQRFSDSGGRADNPAIHAREQARFALDVLQQPERALSLARLNLQRQRETADLLIFARAAAAQPEPDRVLAAQRELSKHLRTWGMQDARLPP